MSRALAPPRWAAFRLCASWELRSLENVPAGPYLSRLQCMCMVGCRFPGGVPAGFAAATQLHHLGFVDSQPSILLTARDIEVLGFLGALTDAVGEQACGCG